MAESNTNAGGEAGGPTWTLRLAGPQDDSNKSLWAGYSRAAGHGPADLIGMLSRRRGLAAGAFLTVFLPAAAWVWTMAPQYRAAASLLVQADSGAIGPAEMMAEVESIQAPAALGRVAGALGLVGEEPGVSEEERIAKAVRILQEGLLVGSLPQSGVVTIQYSGPDPESTANVVNTLAGLYVDRQDSRRRAAAARDAGDGELATYERELQRARDELAEFRQRNQTASFATQMESAQARLTQLGADLRRIERQLRQADEKLDRLSAGQGSAEDRSSTQLEADRLRGIRAELLEQRRGAEGWRSQMERLAARHSELEAAVAAAEESYILYQRPEPEPRQSDSETAGPARKVSLLRRAEVPSAPADGGRQLWLLVLSALAAACVTLGAAVLHEPSRRPVSHVADIAASVGAPVLIMIEENQSHVS